MAYIKRSLSERFSYYNNLYERESKEAQKTTSKVSDKGMYAAGYCYAVTNEFDETMRMKVLMQKKIFTFLLRFTKRCKSIKKVI